MTRTDLPLGVDLGDGPRAAERRNGHYASVLGARRVIATAMVFVGVLACSSSTDQSDTPRVMVEETEPAESEVLLAEEDLEGIPEFENLTMSDLRDIPIFENPDPRGPCGGNVSDPPLAGAVGRAFVSNAVSIVELAVAAPEPNEYLQLLVEDSRSEPCDPYDSETNTGDIQHVSDIRVLDLAAIDVPAVGWTSTIEVQGQTIYGGVVAMDTDSWFAFIQFQGATLPTADAIEKLARRAADRLSD